MIRISLKGLIKNLNLTQIKVYYFRYLKCPPARWYIFKCPQPYGYVYLSFAQHYHTAPILCKVRTPEHKGKVESNIDYVQDNALTGKKFNSLDEQNQYLRHWNKTWASTRIHGTTKRQVNAMFDEEKPYLQPLPNQSFTYFQI